MEDRKRRVRCYSYWIRWVVRVVIQVGSGIDTEFYTEDYSGMEWCSRNNALGELYEARAQGLDAYLERREVTRI